MHEQGGRRWIQTIFLSTYSGVGSRSYVGWLMNRSIPLCGDHSLSTLMAAVSLYIRPGTSKQRLWRLQSRQVLCPTKLEMHSEIENTYYIHICTYLRTQTHRDTPFGLCYIEYLLTIWVVMNNTFILIFFLNVFVASDVCIPFIIVSFGVFFLFLSVSFMFGFVSFWFCLPGSLLLLSALRYLSQDNKLNNNHHNTRWI